MDVIELGRQKEEHDDDECEDHYDPIGYDEVLQVLQNYIWSHVDVLQVAGRTVGGLEDLLDEESHHADDVLAGVESASSEARQPALDMGGEEEGEFYKWILSFWLGTSK